MKPSSLQMNGREVQTILAANRHERKLGKQTRYPSLLTGMISDPDGRPMTPVSTHKGSRRHRYYVTRLKARRGQGTCLASASRRTRQCRDGRSL